MGKALIYLASGALLLYLSRATDRFIAARDRSRLASATGAADLTQALRLSVLTSGLSTLITIGGGTPLAYVLARKKVRARHRNMTLYQLRDIQHRYGTRTILDLPALDIQRGEVLGIVGPSGSGKSTLLRLLQFLEPPTSGSFTFDGTLLDGSVPLAVRRRIVTVFQHPALLDRSVFDNVAYGLRLRRQRDGHDLIMQALERVGLHDYAQTRAKTLSGGEAQRVALARALVLNPAALLLDEPTANLDPYNVGLIEEIIRGHGDTTVVLVTHNTFQAKRLADRVGLLLNGKLIELTNTDQFFNHPIDPRTRSFINGEMVY